jgi:electron transfer flavoprotein alpha subunit
VDIVIGDKGKNTIMLLPYLAGLFGREYIGFIDDIEIHNKDIIVIKTIFAGEYNVRYLIKEKPLFATINPQKTIMSFSMERKEVIPIDGGNPFYNIIEVEEKKGGEVDLEGADIIVSVGRGFKDKEDIRLARELAEVLGAVIGCSRPVATDLRWLPEERWIGLSGKKVEPKLYIAIGISGQSQHLAGIRKARKILAINKDEKAPIFKYSDYGVVADLYKVLPVLIDRLRKEKG